MIETMNGIAATPPPTADKGSMVVLNFACAERPVFKEFRGGSRYVKYGENNLYPEYLLSLYNTATKHGSIVSSKATYVKGKGWKAKVEDPRVDAYMAQVNRYGESLQQVWDKAIQDLEIFYGAYIQVIWNNAGTAIAEQYHLDFSRVRTNVDNTQFYYRENWGGTYRTGYNNEEKIYPAFNPANPRGSQIFFAKTYSPGCGAYPVPDYLRGLDYISAEIEVGRHTNGNAQTGFSASKSITMPNGEPSDDEKKKITKSFTKAFTGAEGRKFILNFVASSEKKPIIEDLGASDLTKEDFSAVDELVRDNIFSAHKITTPALFGVSTPGALGQRTELRDGYEIFKNTYVNDKQQFIEQHVNKIAKYSGVQTELQIIPTEPIGVDPVSVAALVPKGWLMEKLGIDPNEYPETAQPGEAEQQLEADTNPLLRNISGRQWQGIKRIIREVQTGKTTDAAARMLLSASYGLTDEQISVLLGTPAQGDELAMSEQVNEVDRAIQIFSEYGVPVEGLFILKSKRVKYADDADAEQREHLYLSFATSELTDLQASILDLIAKDKLINNEVIAETLGEDLETINRATKALEKSGDIKTDGDTRTVPKQTKQDVNKAKPITKTFKVMYSYDGPQDSKNRPFCAKMMQLGRYYTRKEIEQISNRLGYSVWDRRGGFYHNPSTGETTPYCRHTWMSHVVMKQS